MAESRQTTIRFGDILYQRLEDASERTGLPINSIVIVACMEWLQHHELDLAYKRDFIKRVQAKGMHMMEKYPAGVPFIDEMEDVQDVVRSKKEHRMREELRREFEELERLRAEKKRLRVELAEQKRLEVEKRRRREGPDEEPEIEEPDI